MKKFLISAAAALALMPTITVAAQTIPQFSKGDKIVLMGDSITHGGHYHSYIWLYYMTRFPSMRIDLVNAGIGGECAWDMAERMERDFFGRKADYVTLTFGMNDTGYWNVFNSPDSTALSAELVQRSIESFAKIEDRLARDDERGAKAMKKVMIGGSPFDESTRFNNKTLHGKNNAMRKIIACQQEAAQRHGWGFVDFHEPMLDISRREQAKDSCFTFSRIDRIHPDCDGQMVMAYLFLKAQGMDGIKVADMHLRAGEKKALKSDNCKLSNIKGDGNGLSFRYLAKALPYPVDSVAQNGWANKKSAKDAMVLIPFMEEFNQELLKVEGLEEGCYDLSIDGWHIAKLDAARLAEGVNLAEYTNTPQYRQASEIMYLNEERLQVERRLVEWLWVEYSYLRKEGLLFQDNIETLEMLRERAKNDFFLAFSFDWYKQASLPNVRQTWLDYMKALTDRIYSINTPKEHVIKIEKI